jgi:hypothetical protein
MQVIAAELVPSALELKFLLNESAIAFFPVTTQHRDFKGSELSYEEEHRGNALAGLVFRDRVEIRFHRSFSDERVRGIWAKVVAMPELAELKLRRVVYQGREIFG